MKQINSRHLSPSSSTSTSKLSFSLSLSLMLSLSLILTSCGKNSSDDSGDEEMKMSIMGRLKASSELVTTRLQLRSIQNIYIDNGNISLNPKTWKLDRLNNIVVILPLDVTVEYGYDLDDMQVDIVKVNDDKREVWVYLPEPRIISSTYNPRVPKELEVIPSDARPGQGQISRGMQIAYNQVIKTFDAAAYSNEAEQNAQNVFEDILRNVDYKFQSVHIAQLKDRH